MASEAPDTLAYGREPPANRRSSRFVWLFLDLAGIAAATVFALRSEPTSPTGHERAAAPPASISAVPTPTPTPTRSEVQAALDALPVGASLQQLLMVEGRLIDPSSGSDRTVLTLPFTYAWAQRTPHGLLFQGPAGAAGGREQVWALAEDPAGEARTLRYGGVGTMALNADATKAAYVSFDARDPDRPGDDVAFVVLATFPGLRELRRAGLPRPEARVSGFVGERVLLTSGDGADVVVLSWDPAGTIRQLEGWNVVEATEPRTSRAVLRDNSPCPRLFMVRRIPEEPYSTVCLFYPAFSRDGGTYAAFESIDGTPRGFLRVRDLATGSIVGTQTFGGIDPVLWGQLTLLTRDRVLVTVQDPTGENDVRYAVLRCILSEDRCEVAWRSEVVREYRQVSVVGP